MFGSLFLRLGIIYVLILAGMVLKWLLNNIDALTRVLSTLLINILVPLVVFSSIAQFEAAVIDLRIAMFSASIFFLSSFLAYFFFRALTQEGRAIGPFVLASANPNGFYLPFPITFALHGLEGLSYSTIFLLIANIATALYIYPLYSYYSSRNQSSKVKSVALTRSVFLFPPFITSIFGFVYLSLGFSLPRGFAQPMSYVGQLTTYLALLFVGLNVSLKGKRWFSKPVLGVATIRLLALPVALFGLMKCLRLKEVWTEVIIIHSGMPPAVNNIILADHFGLDKKLMATIVTETTALALLALPLLICLVESL